MPCRCATPQTAHLSLLDVCSSVVSLQFPSTTQKLNTPSFASVCTSPPSSSKRRKDRPFILLHISHCLSFIQCFPPTVIAIRKTWLAVDVQDPRLHLRRSSLPWSIAMPVQDPADDPGRLTAIDIATLSQPFFLSSSASLWARFRQSFGTESTGCISLPIQPHPFVWGGCQRQSFLTARRAGSHRKRLFRNPSFSQQARISIHGYFGFVLRSVMGLPHTASMQ